MKPDLENHPDIQNCNERIRKCTDALLRAKDAVSEEVRRKAAVIAVQKEEERVAQAQEERRRTVARVREEHVASIKPDLDATVREARDLTIKAASSHAKLAELWEQGRQANGGRPPFPSLHMVALLPGTAKSATAYDSWRRTIDKHCETPPAPRKRKRLATSKPRRKTK